MLKALMKKQLLEMTAFLFQNKKDGKKRSKISLLLYGLLLLYAFGMIGFLFYQLADFVCEPYFSMGYGWLYFTLFGMMATGTGVFMSIFSIYSTLYQAKDNEFILSLPVPSHKILLAKMLGCYITSFAFEMIVLIPGYAIFFINQSFTVMQIVMGILNLFLLPLFAVSIACILGWIIALVASKTKKNIKTFVTLAISVAFFGLYFYVVSGASDFINVFVTNADEIAGVVKYVLYPVYAMGHGAMGEISSYLIYAGAVLLLFGVVYLVLSKTFLSVVTINKGSSVKKFEKRSLSTSSAVKALLKREFVHLKSSATYMLNCCMGTLMTLMTTVFVIIKHDIFEMLPSELAGLIACAVIAFISGMNDFTAPSISLEGKSIWIVQTLPVSAWKVLKAKITTHMILTAIPSLILTVVLEVLIDLPMAIRFVLPAYAVIFPLFEAAFGLILNLKMPNLNWTDEMIAVKQGANVIIAIFGSWAVVIVLGVLYVAVMDLVSSSVYVILAGLLVLAVTVVMLLWIKKKGTKIFSTL